MSPDLINGLFCIIGAGFMLNTLRVLFNDKMVRGVSIVSNTFFCSWNVWSMLFYWSLMQWWSFAGQVVVVVLYITYIVMLIFYRRRERTRTGVKEFFKTSQVGPTEMGNFCDYRGGDVVFRRAGGHRVRKL